MEERQKPWLPLPDPLGVLERITKDEPLQIRDPLAVQRLEKWCEEHWQLATVTGTIIAAVALIVTLMGLMKKE